MKEYTTEQLWNKYLSKKSTKWRNLLVVKYMPVVYRQAAAIKSRVPEHIEMEDLVNSGVFGLLRSVESFDPKRGVNFVSYCSLKVRGAIIDYLRDIDHASRGLRTKANKITNIKNTFQDVHGRAITEIELAKHLKISHAEYKTLIQKTTIPHTFSLDHSVNQYCTQEGDNGEMFEMNILQAKSDNDPSKELQRKEFWNEITRGLSRTDKMIIIGYYREGLIMRDVGKAVGLTESRVSQKLTLLLKQLKARQLNKLQ